MVLGSRISHAQRRVVSLFVAATLTVGGAGFWLPGDAHNSEPARLLTEQPSISLPDNLIAYDAKPLGDRMPLILVHGIGGDDPSDFYHWQNFLNFTRDKKDFNDKFKIYLFTYNTARSVPEGSASFRKTMHSFLEQTDADIKMVGYSEGGLLVRDAIQDVTIDARTKEVITIATPFHGSPLATPKWFRQQLETDAPLSPMKLSQNIAYWVAYKKHPSFAADFQWDNFDGAIPEDIYKSMNGRGVINGYRLASRDNFITYGSYFGEEIVDPDQQLPRELGVTEKLPEERSKLKNLFRQNILFSFVNKNMSKVTAFVWPHQKDDKIHPKADEQVMAMAVADTLPETSDNDNNIPLRGPNGEIITGYAVPIAGTDDTAAIEEDADNTSLTAYNDGISPISSSLWLGRFTPKFSTITSPISKLWAALKGLKGTDQARLFAGMDHRNWMDGETRTSTDQVRDLLNPDEKPKTVFDWLVFDLMS